MQVLTQKWKQLSTESALKGTTTCEIKMTVLYMYVAIILYVLRDCKYIRIVSFDVTRMYVGQRMKEAWELDQFHRAVEDELVWVKEAETLLSNEDIGKDLQGVRFLLKNHQVLSRTSKMYILGTCTLIE